MNEKACCALVFLLRKLKHYCKIKKKIGKIKIGSNGKMGTCLPDVIINAKHVGGLMKSCHGLRLVLKPAG